MKSYLTRTLLLILCTFMLIPSFASCSKSKGDNTTASAKITAINMFYQGDIVELDVGERSSKMHITVTSEGDFTRDMIEFISENEKIATVDYESTTLTNFIYFTILGVSGGETDIYFKAADSDVVSDKIHIIVNGGDAETETSPDTGAETTDTAAPDTTAAATAESYTASTEPSSVQGSAPVYTPTPTGKTVYVTPSGKKYHYSASCAGANATPIDEGTAMQSYEPCKKCTAGDVETTEYTAPAEAAPASDSQAVYDGTTVYITPTGKKYHLSASCAGKNAIPTTKESAEKTYEPCKKCAQ